MTLITTSEATFDLAWAQLQDGDTLTLQGDFLQPHRPKGRAFAGGVTINAEGARLLAPWYWAGAQSGLTWIGGVTSGLRWDGGKSIAVREIDSIAGGVTFTKGENLSVEDSRFMLGGVAFSYCKHVVARRSSFWKMAADGIDGGCVQGAVFEDNAFHLARLLDDHHPDAIQCWSRPDMVSGDIVIRKNLIRCQGAQGISLFNHTRVGVNDGGFDRVTIDGNDITVGYPDALTVTEGRSVVVTNNTVRTWPGSRWQAQIHTDTCTGLTRTGNTVEAFGTRRAVIDP